VTNILAAEKRRRKRRARSNRRTFPDSASFAGLCDTLHDRRTEAGRSCILSHLDHYLVRDEIVPDAGSSSSTISHNVEGLLRMDAESRGGPGTAIVRDVVKVESETLPSRDTSYSP